MLCNADENYILSGKHLRKRLFILPCLPSEGWEGALLDTHTAQLLEYDARGAVEKGALSTGVTQRMVPKIRRDGGFRYNSITSSRQYARSPARDCVILQADRMMFAWPGPLLMH